MSDTASSAWDVVKRSWVIVVVAAIAGAAVAGGLTLARTGVSYTGSSAITVDAIALSSYPRLPKVDVVLGAKNDPAVIAAVAKASGVDAAAVPGSLRVFGSGNPQNKITVTFVAASKDAAQAGAKAGAEAVAAYGKALGEKQLVMHKGLLEADQKALADFEKTTGGDAATRESYRWDLQRALATDRDQYDWLSNAYTFDGNAAVKQSSRRMALIQAVLAGMLAGLFVGVVIAAVREYSRRRALV